MLHLTVRPNILVRRFPCLQEQLATVVMQKGKPTLGEVGCDIQLTHTASLNYFETGKYSHQVSKYFNATSCFVQGFEFSKRACKITRSSIHLETMLFYQHCCTRSKSSCVMNTRFVW